ncbi:TfpX/TfpZ family type IV pilin accessory protein [Hydrogenophaga sp. MI9]|uniref:TfpX/TfpZ family type IV pilin accessory protein n=1 Tax=Hydrogenophaga sp. MI9 TaxID=3453719 RepID=UPI003EEF01A2
MSNVARKQLYTMDGLRDRFRASGIHLGISLIVGLLVAGWVFVVLYPYPFREISGGGHLFSVLVGVDVVVGPLLTWLVFNRRKPIEELRRDLIVVAGIQLVALTYGLWSMYQARPVYLVHEVDRFVVITSADIEATDLREADVEFQTVPNVGIRTIGLREAKNPGEKLKATELAIAGKDLSLQPRFWQTLSEQNREAIRRRAQPLEVLRSHSEDVRQLVDQWIADRAGRASDYLTFPLVSRAHYWTVVLDKDLNMVGYLPIDPF